MLALAQALRRRLAVATRRPAGLTSRRCRSVGVRTSPRRSPVVAGVLLVEDNEASSRGLARLLEAQGFDVTTADDGQAALPATRRRRPPRTSS